MRSGVAARARCTGGHDRPSPDARSPALPTVLDADLDRILAATPHYDGHPRDRYEAASALRVLILFLTRPVPEPVVHCPSCDRDLPASAFNRNRSRPSGLDWRCRACLSSARRKTAA